MLKRSTDPAGCAGESGSGIPRDQLLASALVCIEDFYRRMFRTWPGAVNQPAKGYTLSFSGDTTLSGANHLWPYPPAGLSEAALSEAEAFFRAHRATWSVVYLEPLFPQASELLRRCGYTLRWDAPLLVWEGPPPPTPQNGEAVVVRATTPQHLAAVRGVMEEAFLSGEDVSRRVVRNEHLDDPEVAHYLVYAGPEPVTCGTVVRHEGMAGVWNVGTRCGFRRRGYATLLMTTLLRDLAALGCTTSILMASPSGEPLYLQLGFRPIGRLRYMGPPDDLTCWWGYGRSQRD